MRRPSPHSLACLLLLAAVARPAPTAAQRAPTALQPTDVAELIVAGYDPAAFWSNFQKLPRAFPVNDSSIALIRRLVRKQGGRWPADSIGMVRVLARLRLAAPPRTIARAPEPKRGAGSRSSPGSRSAPTPSKGPVASSKGAPPPKSAPPPSKTAPACRLSVASAPGRGSEPGSSSPEAAGARGSSAALELELGETGSVAAALHGSAGGSRTARSPEWWSDDPGIARVTAAGRIDAVSLGATSLHAACAGKVLTARVSVVPGAVAGITVTQDTVPLDALGASARVAAELRNRFDRPIAGLRPEWTSTDPDVADVDGDGRVRAASTGEALVVAEAAGHADTAVVVVRQVPAKIAVTPASLSLSALGAGGALSATLLDALDNPIAHGPIVWESSDTAVAEVSRTGKVTAVGNGRTTVRAWSSSLSAAVRVIVRQQPATVSLSQSDATLAAVGHTLQLSATVADANGYALEGARLSWTSSDSTSVAVDSTGLLRATGRGEAEIRAWSGDATTSLRARVPEYNVLVAAADGYEATLVSNDLPASPLPDVTRPVEVFRLSCARCQRFNVRLDPFRVGWAAGRYCRRDRNGPVPIAVKGRRGPAVIVRACCPEDAPCAELSREEGGWSAGTAHFLVAVRADGSVTSTVEEYLEVCPEERGGLEGAVDYPPWVLEDLSWPRLDADDLTASPAGSAAGAPEPDTRRARSSTP